MCHRHIPRKAQTGYEMGKSKTTDLEGRLEGGEVFYSLDELIGSQGGIHARFECIDEALDDTVPELIHVILCAKPTGRGGTQNV